MSRLSTHVLDTALGRPAAGMRVQLAYAEQDGTWARLCEQQTDVDGRCANLLPGPDLRPGEYKLRFDTGAYHSAQSVKGFYVIVEIVVTVREGDTHLHVPLLLSPNGYTTYKGS